MTANPQQSTALEKRQPKNIDYVKNLMSKRAPEILALLPTKEPIDKVINRFALQFIKNGELIHCTPESLVMAIYAGAATGLNADPQFQEFYLIPFNKVCNFIIGYRGLMKLVRQHKEVMFFDAQAVYQNDSFSHVQGTTNKIDHHFKLGQPRGSFVGAYAVCKMINGENYIRVMDKEAIDKIKATSKMKTGTIWATHYDQMAIKSVIRNIVKNLPIELSNGLRQALAADDASESDGEMTIDTETGNIIDIPVENIEQAQPEATKSQSRLDNFAATAAPPTPAQEAPKQPPVQKTRKAPAAEQTINVQPEEPPISQEEAKSLVPDQILPAVAPVAPVVVEEAPQVVEEAPVVQPAAPLPTDGIVGSAAVCHICGEDVAQGTQNYNLEAGIPQMTCIVHQAEFE